MSHTIGCSVKEMREYCPCRVDFDMTGIIAGEMAGMFPGRTIEVALYDESGKKCYGRSFGTDTCASHYEEIVPRGRYTVSAVIVRKDSEEMNSERIAPHHGGQIDSLYGISAPLDATGEEAAAALEAYKQFATVSIKLLSAPGNTEIHLSAPSSSVFRQSLHATGDKLEISSEYDGGISSFRILRQDGYDLALNFINLLTGERIASIDLGPRLKEIGYDFSAADLADIIIIADLDRGMASITVDGWQEELLFIIF